MLERLGIRDRYELAVFACLLLLVAVTPLGKESSHPTVFGISRSLLLFIIVSYIAWTDRSRLPRISTGFLGAAIGLVAIMLVSLLRWQGSLFESFYLFYENVLFIAAFIALAHGATGRSSAWKHAILASVVLINAAYIGGALILGNRPILGPFVNQNYFASFVLPGLAICTATVFLASSIRIRATAAGMGLFLYFGIGQTASRGATLAAMALLGLAGFRAARRRGFSVPRLAMTLALLLTLTVALNPALVRKFLDRGERDPYNYQRIGIWMGTLEMIAEHPIAGVGLGHFFYVAKLFTPGVENTIGHYRRYPNIAHSEYLQYIAEIGVPGALLLFGLGASLLTLAWKRANHTGSENVIVQESALLAAAGLCVHALVDNNWTVPVMAAGLAVISQADLLPYGGETTMPQRAPGLRPALALIFLAVWLDAALIPSIGLYFNEAGHQAYDANDLDSAELNHRFALAVIPRHPGLLDNLGTVYLHKFMETKKPEYLDRAEMLFSDSMAENAHFETPAGHLESALVQRLTGDPQTDRAIHMKIIKADQHYLKANPFNPFIRKNLAEAFYNVGDRNQACEELLKAIDLEPNYVSAYLRLADWYEEAGQMELSARYRNQAIQVVKFYKDKPTDDLFEKLLLGRPQPAKQQ